MKALTKPISCPLSRAVLASLTLAGLAMGCTNDTERAQRIDTVSTTSSGAVVASNDDAARYDNSAMVDDSLINEKGTVSATTRQYEPAAKPAARPVAPEGKERTFTRSNSDFNRGEVRGEEIYREQPQEDVVYTDTANEDTISSTTTSNTVTESQYLDANHNPASNLTPFAQEPNSRIPAHVGSVQITGKDKSVAAMEMNGVFTDPAALYRNANTHAAIAPIARVDFDRYSYERRGTFQSAMSARVWNLESNIDELRARAKAEPASSAPADVNNRIASVEGERLALKKDVMRADDVSRSEWGTYRSDFRTRLLSLEQELARLDVAIR